MNFYHDNLQYLQKNNPAVYQALASTSPVDGAVTTLLPDIHNAMIKTSSGECYLHSLYNREREMERLVAAANPDAKIVVLFGLGMGEMLPHIRQYFPLLEQLVIIEPNSDIFKQFLQGVKLAEIVQTFPALSIVVNQTPAAASAALNKLLQANLFRQVECVGLISYRTLYGAYYSSVYETIVSAIRRMRGNLATKRIFAERWLSNEWRNQRYADRSFEHLFCRLSGLPVVLVSAGPSLRKNLHLLPETKKKAIVIAVGSAMTILETHGITPHFRMALDGNDSCQAVLNAVDTSQCPLIYSNMLYHEILPRYEGEKFEIVLVSDWLTRYLREKQGLKSMIVNTGYSIANSAFDLACRLGAPKVILTGQDLCYTDNRFHAEGAWDDNMPSRSINEKTMVSIKDLYNQDVYTDTALLNMKASFEEMRLSYPNVDCINATEGGLVIKGIRNQSLQQILDTLPVVPDISTQIAKAMEETVSLNRQAFNAAETVAAELAEIIKINDDRLALIGSLKSREGQAVAVDWFYQQLASIEKLSEQLQQIDYYAQVLYPLLADFIYANRIRLDCAGNEKAEKAESLLRTYAGEAADLGKMTKANWTLLQECEGKMPYSILRDMM